jgi:hypothetical protein
MSHQPPGDDAAARAERARRLHERIDELVAAADDDAAEHPDEPADGGAHAPEAGGDGGGQAHR